ncbi:hypothetical protein GMRT_10931 [Giardia muris]|uniref:Uncharacterized protein n=1 Tax=Giardia muris TaxID=5742 RepID=A0A4Z1T463_GIAMU|nr:hypothetical protein GMRT_10931 [Giardia muris]|eukprot:TNJ30448.1 hypothetical protein GMRT_10931 [Giardia muris]
MAQVELSYDELFTILRSVGLPQLEVDITRLDGIVDLVKRDLRAPVPQQIPDGVKPYHQASSLDNACVPYVLLFNTRASAHRTVLLLTKTIKRLEAANQTTEAFALKGHVRRLLADGLHTHLVDSLRSFIDNQAIGLNAQNFASSTPEKLLTAQLAAADCQHVALVLFCIAEIIEVPTAFCTCCELLANTIENLLVTVRECAYNFPRLITPILSSMTAALHIVSLAYILSVMYCQDDIQMPETRPSRELHVVDILTLLEVHAGPSIQASLFWLHMALSNFLPRFPQERLNMAVAGAVDSVWTRDILPALRAGPQRMIARPIQTNAFGQVVHSTAGGSNSSVLSLEERLNAIRGQLAEKLVDESFLEATFDLQRARGMRQLADFPVPDFSALKQYAYICLLVYRINSGVGNAPIQVENEQQYYDYLRQVLSNEEFAGIITRLTVMAIALFARHEDTRQLHSLPLITTSLGPHSECVHTYVHDDFEDMLPLIFTKIGALFGTAFSWLDPVVKQCRLREAESFYRLVDIALEECMHRERQEIGRVRDVRRTDRNVGISRYNHMYGAQSGFGGMDTDALGQSSVSIALSGVSLELSCSRLMACIGCLLTVGGDDAYRGLNSDGIVQTIISWLLAELDTPSQILGAFSIAQGLSHCPEHGVEHMHALLQSTREPYLTAPFVDLIGRHRSTAGAQGSMFGAVATTSLTADPIVFDCVTAYACPFSIYYLSKVFTLVGGIGGFPKEQLQTTGIRTLATATTTAFGVVTNALTEAARGPTSLPARINDDSYLLTARDVITDRDAVGYLPQLLTTNIESFIVSVISTVKPLTEMSLYNLIVLEQTILVLSQYMVNPSTTAQIAFFLLLRISSSVSVAPDHTLRNPKFNGIIENATGLRYLRLLEATLKLLAHSNGIDSLLFLGGFTASEALEGASSMASALTEVAFQAGPLFEATRPSLSNEVEQHLHNLEDALTSLINSSLLSCKAAYLDLLSSYLSSSLCIYNKARVRYMTPSVTTVARQTELVVITQLNQAFIEVATNKHYADLLGHHIQQSHTLHLFVSILHLFSICLRSTLGATWDDLIASAQETPILDNFIDLAQAIIEILIVDKDFLPILASFIKRATMAALYGQYIYTVVPGSQTPLIETPLPASEQSVALCVLFASRMFTLAELFSEQLPHLMNSAKLFADTRVQCPYFGDLPGCYTPQNQKAIYNAGGASAVRTGNTSMLTLLLSLFDRFTGSSVHQAAKYALINMRKVLTTATFTSAISSSCNVREVLGRLAHSFVHSDSCADNFLSVLTSCYQAHEYGVDDLLSLFLLGVPSERQKISPNLLEVDPVSAIYYPLRRLHRDEHNQLWLIPSVVEQSYLLLSMFLECMYSDGGDPRSKLAITLISDLESYLEKHRRREFFLDTYEKTLRIVRLLGERQAYYTEEAMDSDTLLELTTQIHEVLFAVAACLRLLTVFIFIAFRSQICSDESLANFIATLFGTVVSMVCWPGNREDDLNKFIDHMPQPDRALLDRLRNPENFDKLSDETVGTIASMAAVTFDKDEDVEDAGLKELIVLIMGIVATSPRPQLSDLSRQAMTKALWNLTGSELRLHQMVSLTQLGTQVLLMPISSAQRERIMQDATLVNASACVSEAFTAVIDNFSNLLNETYTTLHKGVKDRKLANCGTRLPATAIFNGYIAASTFSLSYYVNPEDMEMQHLTPEVLNGMLLSINLSASFVRLQLNNKGFFGAAFVPQVCFRWLYVPLRVLANLAAEDNDFALQQGFSTVSSVLQAICYIIRAYETNYSFVIDLLTYFKEGLKIQAYFTDAIRLALSLIEVAGTSLHMTTVTDYLGHTAIAFLQNFVELVDALSLAIKHFQDMKIFFDGFFGQLITQNIIGILFRCILGIGMSLFAPLRAAGTTNSISQAILLASDASVRASGQRSSPLTSGAGYDIPLPNVLFIRGLLLATARYIGYGDVAGLEKHTLQLLEQGNGWLELLQLLTLNTQVAADDVTAYFVELQNAKRTDGDTFFTEVMDTNMPGSLSSSYQYEMAGRSPFYRIHIVGHSFLTLLVSTLQGPIHAQHTMAASTTVRGLVTNATFAKALIQTLENGSILQMLNDSIPGYVSLRQSPLPLILSSIFGEVEKAVTVLLSSNVITEEVISQVSRVLYFISEVLPRAVPSRKVLMDTRVTYIPLSVTAILPALSISISILVEYLITKTSPLLDAKNPAALLSLVRDVGGSVLPLVDSLLNVLVTHEDIDKLNDCICEQCINKLIYLSLFILHPDYSLIIDKVYSGDAATRPNVGFITLSGVLDSICKSLQGIQTESAERLTWMIEAIRRCQPREY